jgi:hypothetical protein
MEWFVAREGQSFGPFTFSVVADAARSGELRRDDEVWHAGLEGWVQASTVVDLWGVQTAPAPASESGASEVGNHTATDGKSERSTRTWVFKWLGILWATGTVISLAKHGLKIELRGLPEVIYQQYAWLRDMLFEPIVWAVPKLSPQAKDGFVLYALFSATASRACVRYYRLYHWRSATTYEGTFFALFWPLVVFVSVPVAGTLTIEAIIVGSVTVAFFFWNYLGNVYGPG